MPFRWNTKSFFLTYPQCNQTKEDALTALHALQELDGAVVGHELHADGGNHLHVCGAFKERFRSRDASSFDVVGGGKHGDYARMRSKKKAVEYCTKDKDYVSFNMDVEEYLKGGQGVGQQVVKMIQDGASHREILEEHPAYYLQNRKKIIDLEGEVELWKEVVPSDFVLPMITKAGVGWDEVVDWMEGNLCKDRPFKQPQLWLQRRRYKDLLGDHPTP